MKAVGAWSRPAWVPLLAALALLGSWPCVAMPTGGSEIDDMLTEALVRPDPDYYDVYTDPPPQATPAPSPGNQSDPQLCHYDVCLEQKVACSVLAALHGCLCRGITLETVVPETPSGASLSPGGGGGGVVVGWCAPYSLVTAYVIKVAEKERARVGGDRRSGGLKGLNHGDTVCVSAENGAGEGPEACVTYREDEDAASLTAGLVGGALGLLLVAALAALLWTYTRRRKAGARISTQDESQRDSPDSDRGTRDVL